MITHQHHPDPTHPTRQGQQVDVARCRCGNLITRAAVPGIPLDANPNPWSDAAGSDPLPVRLAVLRLRADVLRRDDRLVGTDRTLRRIVRIVAGTSLHLTGGIVVPLGVGGRLDVFEVVMRVDRTPTRPQARVLTAVAAQGGGPVPVTHVPRRGWFPAITNCERFGWLTLSRDDDGRAFFLTLTGYGRQAIARLAATAPREPATP